MPSGRATHLLGPLPILSNARLINDLTGRCCSRVKRALRSSRWVASTTATASCVVAAFVIAACGADAVIAPQPKAIELHPLEQLIVAAGNSIAAATAAGPAILGFSTYDGSGQVVHPDVVSFDAPWNGHKLWNAITPYPNSATRFENPSLFSSDDGDTWGVPEGVTNPLSRTKRGYLSDPDMLFDSKSGQMWLYYREVHTLSAQKGVTTHVADNVWLTTSPDAINWSPPRQVVSDSGRYVVSPSIVRTTDGGMSMYQIDAGRGGCSARATRITRRRSVNGLDWTAPVSTSFTQVGFIPWHLDVQYIPSRSEYWALVAAYEPTRGCMTTSLFLATSTDGVRWTTYPTPVLAAGEIPQFGAAVYRSTFALAANDSLTIWFSGARTVRLGSRKRAGIVAWSAAVTHTTAAALLSRVNDKTRGITLSVAATPGTAVVSANNVP